MDVLENRIRADEEAWNNGVRATKEFKELDKQEDELEAQLKAVREAMSAMLRETGWRDQQSMCASLRADLEVAQLLPAGRERHEAVKAVLFRYDIYEEKQKRSPRNRNGGKGE